MYVDIYIYISNWIIGYIEIKLYIIYSYVVNVNLMLICIELSELILYLFIYLLMGIHSMQG